MKRIKIGSFRENNNVGFLLEDCKDMVILCKCEVFKKRGKINSKSFGSLDISKRKMNGWDLNLISR